MENKHTSRPTTVGAAGTRKKPRQSFNVTYPIPYRKMARAEDQGRPTRHTRAVTPRPKAQQVGTTRRARPDQHRHDRLRLPGQRARRIRRSPTAERDRGTGIVSAGTSAPNRPGQTFANPWIGPPPRRILATSRGQPRATTVHRNGTRFSDNIDGPAAAPTRFLGT